MKEEFYMNQIIKMNSEFSSVLLGSYEYSDGGPIFYNSLHIKYPIEWLILDTDLKNNRMLLLSKNVLDSGEFSDFPQFEKRFKPSWKKSNIRKWLNTVFYNSVFSKEEKAIICEYQTLPPSTGQIKTFDKIFLLNEREFNKYFFNKQAMAYMNYLVQDDEEDCITISPEPWPWWLRSTNSEEYLVRYIDRSGNINNTHPAANETGIRPAMWINCS